MDIRPDAGNLEKMMIVLMVRYAVEPGKVAAVLEALERMKLAMEKDEPDCLHYQASLSVEDPDAVLLYEVYRDEEALARHGETSHFKRIIQGEIIPMLKDRVRERFDARVTLARAQ